jgi:hypothetical protein
MKAASVNLLPHRTQCHTNLTLIIAYSPVFCLAAPWNELGAGRSSLYIEAYCPVFCWAQQGMGAYQALEGPMLWILF